MRILRQRNFALVWSANMMGAMGNQTEALVLGWFVLTLTDSPFLVGLITAARLFMNPLAVFAGAIADRVPRNLLLAIVEFTVAATGLLMLVLILGLRGMFLVSQAKYFLSLDLDFHWELG